jgi:DtxR family Mn-dependent transcriptional regulator
MSEQDDQSKTTAVIQDIGLSESVQDYLKSIYKLASGETPGSVTTSLIAERMKVSAASATNMIKKLAELNLLDHTPYQGVELTSVGEKIALEVIRHHRLLELYLSQALGFGWDEVDAEADRLEHAISEDFEDRMDRVLGFPTVGARGEPIPTKDGAIATHEYRRLADLDEGQSAHIRQVSDRNSDLLRYLDEKRLHLGALIVVEEKAPFRGPMLVSIDGEHRHHIGIEVAENVFVEDD